METRRETAQKAVHILESIMLGMADSRMRGEQSFSMANRVYPIAWHRAFNAYWGLRTGMTIDMSKPPQDMARYWYREAYHPFICFWYANTQRQSVKSRIAALPTLNRMLAQEKAWDGYSIKINEAAYFSAYLAGKRAVEFRPAKGTGHPQLRMRFYTSEADERQLIWNRFDINNRQPEFKTKPQSRLAFTSTATEAKKAFALPYIWAATAYRVRQLPSFWLEGPYLSQYEPEPEEEALRRALAVWLERPDRFPSRHTVTRSLMSFAAS
jgi:hypothetical protein